MPANKILQLDPNRAIYSPAETTVDLFVSYRTKLAVIVRDASVHGGRFGELMNEHRIHPTVRFFTAEQTARQWLSQMPSGKR